MKIWVDDIRIPPGSWDSVHHIWAKTSSQAIAALERCHVYGTRVEEISLDHDLGGDDDSKCIVTWMIENDFWPDEIYVHSANPIGREWLEGTISRYRPRKDGY